MAKKVRAKVDWKSIGRKIASSHKLNKELENVCKRKFRKSKAKLMNNFNNHPVTQEIIGGSSSQNVSGALEGYGNLFSFMGFASGTDPTKAVKNFLKSFISLNPKGRTRGNVREYQVKIPSMDDFNFARMPWESGNNWVRAVEMGVSSFSYYMDKAHKSSRSGGGIQIDNKLRGRSSTGMSYMTQLLEEFRKKLTR